jgi:transketolase
MDDRDWLVMSKGHAGPALYATLALKGFFPKDWLSTLNRGGTRLPSHCDRNKDSRHRHDHRIPGPGFFPRRSASRSPHGSTGRTSEPSQLSATAESDEGQIWEAAMLAGNRKLSRLIAFTDYNKQQLDGYTKGIADLDDLDAKWRAFGWNVLRENAHDVEALDGAIDAACAQDRSRR